MHPCRVGELSEAALLTALLRRGYVVLSPWGGTQRYDFVIDKGDGFERVQCKTGRIQNGVIVVSAQSNTNGAKSYRGEVEHIGVYCPELEKCYLVPMKILGKFAFNLRLEPTKNGQAKKILWAKDFEL